MTGFLAESSALANSLKEASEGLTLLSMRTDWPNSISAISLRMSPGKLMKTGPVGGVMAILAARRMMSGRSCNLVTSIDHFTKGAAMVAKSS